MGENIFGQWELEPSPRFSLIRALKGLKETFMDILETLGNPGLPLELQEWFKRRHPHLPKIAVISVNALFFIVLTVWIFGFCWLWVPAFLITAIWDILGENKNQ